MKNSESNLIDKKEWIPNWKNEKEYSVLTNQENKNNYYLFAWQFLRRNKFYAQDFELAKSLLLELNKEYGSEDYEKKIKNPQQPIHFPEKPENVAFYTGHPIQWRLREENRKVINESLKKWGLEAFFDPSITNQRYLEFRTNELLVNCYNENHLMNQKIPYGYASVMINMNKNIASQLESVISYLKWHQDSFFSKDQKPHFRPQDYIIYLRLIDALIADEEPKIIKQTIYKANLIDEAINTKYKDHKKAALSLVNGGYKKFFNIL